MPIKFNAEEILEMAVKIERNGARFYRGAAADSKDAHAVNILNRLADMEDAHQRIFVTMMNDLASNEKEPKVFDPENQTVEYLRAMADGYVFNAYEEPSTIIKQGDSLEKIFKTALGMEKDSIVFYLGIKDMIPTEVSKRRVDDIIREEMSHIVIINTELADIASARR